MHPLLPLVGIGLLVLSWRVVKRGSDSMDRYRRLVGTPDVESADLYPGRTVTLSGTARGERTFWSPVERRECLLAAWRVERYSGGGGHGNNWKTVASGAHAVPFDVDDGTNRVSVDLRARSAEGDLASCYDDWLDGAGRVDDEIRQLFEGTEQVIRHAPDELPEYLSPLYHNEDLTRPRSRALNAVELVAETDERRYFETIVTPGDEVFVQGPAYPNPGAAGSLGPHNTVVRPPADGNFVASNRPEGAVRAYFRNRMLFVPVALLPAVLAVSTVPAALFLPDPMATVLAMALGGVALIGLVLLSA